ncbi:MAG: arylamine N-acetyltransferase [Myxococcota bacterium]
MDSSLLERYFARIGYGGPTPPTVDTLHALALAHACAVPFENLDPWLGRPVSLRLDDVVAKLVLGGRGGYCFEQNGLMLEVLDALGFRVTPLSARVRVQRPRDYTPPRTHLFVRVDLADGPWLVDVGVGGLSVTAALRWTPDVVQDTPHEARRFVVDDGRWFHQVRLGDTWADVCEFTGEAMPPIDREVANWYTSTHPASSFRTRLVAARATPDGGRRTLADRLYTVRDADGVATVARLDAEDALRRVLTDAFGLTVPPGPIPMPPSPPDPALASARG